MSIELVMPSNHLVICHPLLFLPSIFPSIKVFSSESGLCIMWPKYWSFSFSISPSNEYSKLISFRIGWLDLLAVQETLKSLLHHQSSKTSILQRSAFYSMKKVWIRGFKKYFIYVLLNCLFSPISVCSFWPVFYIGKVKVLVAKSCPLFVIPWTVPYQAPLSTEFFKQEYWSGLPFHSPGDLPNPRIKPRSPALQADSLPSELSGKRFTLEVVLSLWSFLTLHTCVRVKKELSIYIYI